MAPQGMRPAPSHNMRSSPHHRIRVARRRQAPRWPGIPQVNSQGLHLRVPNRVRCPLGLPAARQLAAWLRQGPCWAAPVLLEVPAHQAGAPHSLKVGSGQKSSLIKTPSLKKSKQALSPWRYLRLPFIKSYFQGSNFLCCPKFRFFWRNKCQSIAKAASGRYLYRFGANTRMHFPKAIAILAIFAFFSLPVFALSINGVHGTGSRIFSFDEQMAISSWPEDYRQLCIAHMNAVIKRCSEACYENWVVDRMVSGTKFSPEYRQYSV